MNNKKISLPRTPAAWLEAVMNFIFFLCGILAVGCVLLISVYMVLSGVPAIQKIGLFRFLFGTRWASTAADPAYGILPFILSSVYGTLGATVIGVPIGLLTAVFLSKAAGPKVRTVVVTAIELLSGIPSVVFGLLGMQVLVPAVAKAFGKASGACLLSAIVVLSIMILPSIVSVSSRPSTPCRRSMSRAAWLWAQRMSRPGSRSASPLPGAALPPVSCWASAAPSARPWP